MSIKPTPSTVRKKARAAEPDLVDRIFALLVIAHPELSPRFVEIKAAIRRQVGGERLYVRRKDPVVDAILGQWNGRNAAQLARELGIGRSTVYRVLKQPGK